MLIGEKKQRLASPCAAEVKKTIGTGDSSVARFVYGMAKGKSLNETLTHAVAADTATTQRSGTALCQKDDFLNPVPRIQLHTVGGGRQMHGQLAKKTVQLWK
jgi:fructose-1-phosphate kinase PfkB-like protein